MPLALNIWQSHALSASEDAQLEVIRDKRNKIADGKAGPITLREALTIGRNLRDMAAKIDKHAVEHFFVLEVFA
jgi:hypothetical protein